MQWLDIVSGVGLPMLGYAIRVLVGIRGELATLRAISEHYASDIATIYNKLENHNERLGRLEHINLR